MKRSTFLRSLGALGLIGASGTPVWAAGKTWKISLAQLPVVSESNDKGVLVDFVRALEKSAGDKVELQVVPFARSIADVQEKRVDMHMPLIQLPGSETGTPAFDYSTETIFHVNFVIYSTKGVDISPANIKQFKVETEQAHVGYFDFPVTPSSNIEGSLKKVNAGRVDAFVFADSASDPVVKSAALTNLRRQLYRRFDVKVVLPKGGRGSATDKWLSEHIAKLRGSGDFGRIMGPIDAAYQNWQP